MSRPSRNSPRCRLLYSILGQVLHFLCCFTLMVLIRMHFPQLMSPVSAQLPSGQILPKTMDKSTIINLVEHMKKSGVLDPTGAVQLKMHINNLSPRQWRELRKLMPEKTGETVHSQENNRSPAAAWSLTDGRENEEENLGEMRPQLNHQQIQQYHHSLKQVENVLQIHH